MALVNQRKLPNNRGYSVDIQGHHALCEMNFHRLLRLMPGREAGVKHWGFSVGQLSNNKAESETAAEAPVNNADINREQPSLINVSISVVDSAPYTTTVELQQTSFLPLLKKPKILVRMYHDAAMAEIVGWDRHRHWRPQYLYPNAHMYQPDEKLALNKFLGEWLEFCRKHGYLKEEFCDKVLVNGK